MKKQVLVFFSGGRDSSATAVLLAQKGYHVKLYTYQAGMGELVGFRGDSAPDIRHKELLQIFPNNVDPERVIEGSMYLIRELAIKKTNKEHVVYPIALALAFHTAAICYCLKNNIKVVASGYSGYQSTKDNYIEQRSDFVTRMREFLKEYEIEYLTPVIDKTEDEVKDVLEKFGVSSNSLENKSVFGGVYFDKERAIDFWNTSVPICRDFITATMDSNYQE